MIHELEAAYDREGIAIPYPQRELSTRGPGDGDGGVRIPDAERERADGEELSYSERE